MKIRSVFIASGSGSVGGATLSRNKGGMYLRTRSIPTNPNTPRQQAVRAILGQLASRWTNILTPAQRAAWNLYAQNVTVTNPLGEAIQLSGQQHFIRSNVPAMQAEIDPIDSGPTIYNLGEFTAPSNLVLSMSLTSITVDLTDTDDWASENGSFILFYQGRPQGAGTSFFKGPFRFCGSIEGDTEVQPTLFETTKPPFVLTTGNQGWVRAQVLRADGRLSQSVIIGPKTVVA